jgi:HPr kinase/phosphorylase
MTAGPVLARVFERLAARLGLDDTALAQLQGVYLPAAAGEEDQPSPVGHLNLVQPHSLQVLGATEIRYWTERASAEREQLLTQLFHDELCCLVIADGLEPPDDIAARAREVGVPVVAADAACGYVIRALRHELAHELAARTVLHGVFLDVLGIGLLLTGSSRVGKSELALELLSRGHTLVADDAPEFRSPAPGTIEGAAPEVLQDFLEVTGIGVLDIRAMYGDAAIRRQKRLQLILHLEPLTSGLRGQLDRLNGNFSHTQVLGTPVDTMTLPVAPGRNLAVMAEAAVRNFLLRQRGYSPADALMARQQGAMQTDERCD